MLDLGCGDGLIGFGALQQKQAARVIFTDVSSQLLDEARAIAQQPGVVDKCEFVNNAAEHLAAIPDSSVDAVTVRSVLTYVSAKQKAFAECYRVLKPHKRLSLFEPITALPFPSRDMCYGDSMWQR